MKRTVLQPDSGRSFSLSPTTASVDSPQPGSSREFLTLKQRSQYRKSRRQSRSASFKRSSARADQLRAVVAALVEAALELALLIDRVERPIAEDRKNQDDDHRGEVDEVALLGIVLVILGSAHAEVTRSGSTKPRGCRAPPAPWRRCPSRRGLRRRTCGRACRDSGIDRAGSWCES